MGWHVESELVAYLDGELDARERVRVEDHLAVCPACAAELERLRTLQQDLSATFDAALTPVGLPEPANHRIRERLEVRSGIRPHPWWKVWQRRGLIVQALLALLVLAFALNITQVHLPPPVNPHETLVYGQDRLAPGSRAALRVVVRSADETAGRVEPVEGAEVVVRIGRTPGLASVIYTGRTDANGTADVAFTVPDDLEGRASLVVETSSAGGEDQIVRPIDVTREYKLFLSTDKPAYRPGQTIHLRALALDATDLRPVAGQTVTFVLLDPGGEGLEHSVVKTSDFGIAALDFALLPNAAFGRYTLQAALGDTLSERTVAVEAYELPAFRVALEPDRDFYTPGQRVTGVVQAEYFFDRPVVDGQVTVRGYVGELDRQQVVHITGRTDAQGRFGFAFGLPPTLGATATVRPISLDVEAEVTDATGRREGIRRLLSIAAQPILISAIPESGVLKPGVENALFILTSYPDGQPVETELIVEVDGEMRTLSTDTYGLAVLRYRPTDSIMVLDVRARDAQGAEGRATFSFESDRAPQTLLLRAERAAYEVGETLRAEVLMAGGGDAERSIVYLDIVRARQTVATLSAAAEDGRAVFALDLDGTMVGTLELHAYAILDDGTIVRDTRLVIVDAPCRVAVAVAADQDRYSPGDVAHLQFRTTISQTAQPVQSALGIGVVDESVYALEDQPPGFVQAYFLLERELRERRVRGLDVPMLLDAETEIRSSQDVAARAAWAGASGTRFSLSEKSVAERREVLTALDILSSRISLVLVLLSLGLGVVVVGGLRRTGVLGRALRRVGVGAGIFLLASPLVLPVVGGAMWGLWAVLGVGAPALVLVMALSLLLGLIIYGWRRRDVRMQLATGLLATYLALGGALVVLAVRGGNLTGLLLSLIVIAFLCAVAALVTLGQGLVLEGWRGAGWTTTALALMLVLLVVYLPFVPGLASDLTRVLGHPVLYAGPVGWMTGCTTGAPTAEPTEPPLEVAPEEAEATAMPTASARPTAAATASPVVAPEPVEQPYPLRQIFPETLYWSAESVTDENGRLMLDLPMADTITSWRLTALATTREGELGVTTYDLVVLQDFFVDFDLPSTVAQGEEVTVTVTLYNYLERSQSVQIEPAPAGWYTLLPPSDVPYLRTVPPNGVTALQFSIRAEQVGDFSLQVTAKGERISDAVVRDVTVEP